MKIRLNIQAHQDRVNMIASLAQSGYKTWVEENETFPSGIEFYVCFNLKDKSEYSGARIG